MTALEFKNSSLALLEFCLKETKETALSDGLEGEEIDSYCEGLQDAINKINSLPTC